MLDRAARRRLWFGLQTLFGLRHSGFFIPYAHAAGTVAPARKPFNALGPLFTAQEDSFRQVLNHMAELKSDFEAVNGLAPPQPRFEQDWFPALDAAAYYSLIRHHKPARIIEIGSGHSTRFACRAIADGDLKTKISAIDPAPRTDISQLPVTLHQTTLQQVNLDHFDALESGDMLFVDSSHILMPGSDVDLVLNHILPTIPSGVLVHFHDVFLPQPYPDHWPWSAYNEQNGVAALLQSGYKPLFSSHYVRENMAAQLSYTPPKWPQAVESSLWLIKNAFA